MNKPSLTFLLLFTWSASLHAQDGDFTISPERLRADVKYLSSDRLEGRGIGTLGEERTIDFIATEFARAGLKPAGDRGTFYQAVPLVKVTTGSKATLSATKGATIDFALEEDFAGQCKSQQSEDFEADAVFLGHGIHAPEFDWDDYKGMDVKNKVVVVFTNEPPSDDPKFFGGKALTYYGRWSYKFEEATRRGARAVLIIHTNETAGYPYSVVRKLEGAQLERTPGTPALAFAGWLSRKAGDKLLGLAGMNVDDALKASGKRGFKAVDLGVRIKGHIPTTVQKVSTKNVIGIAPGSDPVLKSEAVLYTAHWDHLGVGKTSVGGDNIYNGALDNATGSAILLEMARLWAGQKVRPKRSAIFLATTAEENGLLGAVYYSQRPTVPLGKTALNLNFDTVHPLGIPESVVVSGAERTTAFPLVQDVARQHKLAIDPDKLAHLGMFYRSDHFALARGGVPAFSVHAGEKLQGKPADFVTKVVAEYIAKFYHAPSDEYREEWDFRGFPVLIRFAFDVGRAVANADGLPTWVPGDEFRAAREKSGVKTSSVGEPIAPAEFKQAGITAAWEKYATTLTFGRGQTLALVDDGCKLSMPQWTTMIDGQPKVLVAYDSVDGDSDPSHEGRGYHGSTIGIPSSLNFQGKLGVAYNNQLAVIRGLECCHCNIKDSRTLAGALQWIIDNHEKYRITTVNLAPVDDKAHAEPVPTEIDARLAELRKRNIWVSAPTGNHNFTTGISWPACQPGCFAIGAVKVGMDEIYLDRHARVDLLVPARATSSSNAIACGAAMLLREGIEKSGYNWKADGANLPEAMMAIMQKTGVTVQDDATKRSYRRLDLLAALDHVLAVPKKSGVK